MLIQVIHDNAENILLKTLLAHQGKSTTRNVYQCRFSNFGVAPIDADSVILHIKDHLQDRAGKLLYAADGDLFVQWDGIGREVVRALDGLFMAYYEAQIGDVPPDEVFQHYDFHAHGEELRMECRKKLGVFKTLLEVPEFDENAPPPAPEPEPEPEAIAPVEVPARFNLSQRATLRTQMALRHMRDMPDMLIVEDHPFSRKLLAAALGKTYVCYQARTGAEAIALYAAYAPSIVFLDIELPDMSGHALAQLFRREDPDAYVVMVTANHYAKDVETARANQVQGFIAKPYNKQKIYGFIENYLSRQPKGD